MRTQKMYMTQALYGLILALGVFLVQWFKSQYAVNFLSTETYIVALALLFTGVGIWIGRQCVGEAQAPTFEANAQAIETLGLTRKELEVLQRLTDGCSNQEIANHLFVSISTVKSHLVHIYQKLDVSRRTQAVQKARSLEIVP